MYTHVHFYYIGNVCIESLYTYKFINKVCILCSDLALLRVPACAALLLPSERGQSGTRLLGQSARRHRVSPLRSQQPHAGGRPFAASRLAASPPAMIRLHRQRVGWSFFNVIIIYRVNIHCSYTDDSLQSTGVCGDSRRSPSPCPSCGAELPAPLPAVPCCPPTRGGSAGEPAASAALQLGVTGPGQLLVSPLLLFLRGFWWDS